MAYAFSGYLSRLKPTDISDPSYREILTANFQKPLSVINETDEYGNHRCLSVYNKGLVFKDWHQVGGRVQELNIFMPAYTVNEAFLFIKHISKIDFCLEKYQRDDNCVVYTFTSNNYNNICTENLVTLFISENWVNILIKRDFE